MKKHNLNLENQKYSEEELEFNSKDFSNTDWYVICWTQDLSESFIEKHIDKISWLNLILKNKINEQFIEKHIEKNIPMYEVFACMKLSENFIRKYFKKEYIYLLLDNDQISKKVKKEMKLLMEII